MNFYVSKNGQQLDDQAWAEGLSAWAPIRNILDLGGTAYAHPNFIPVSQPVANVSKSYAQGLPVFVQGKEPVITCMLSPLIVERGQACNGEWISVCLFLNFRILGSLKTSHQIFVCALQRHLKAFNREQGGALLTCLDHLNVPLGHVRFHGKSVLTQLGPIAQPVKILAESLQRAFGCFVLHPLTMPNQGFA